MIERSIVIPKRTNDGRRNDVAKRRIVVELLDIAGGVSVEQVRGIWRGEGGRIFEDASWRVWTLVDAEQDARIIGRLETWRQWTEQECLLSFGRHADAVFVDASTQLSEVTA